MVRDVTHLFHLRPHRILGPSTAKLQPTIFKDTRPLLSLIRHTQLLQITLAERMQAIQACQHRKELNHSGLQIKGNHMPTNKTSMASHNKDTFPQHQVNLAVSTFCLGDSHKISSRVLKNSKRTIPDRFHHSPNQLLQVRTNELLSPFRILIRAGSPTEESPPLIRGTPGDAETLDPSNDLPRAALKL